MVQQVGFQMGYHTIGTEKIQKTKSKYNSKKFTLYSGSGKESFKGQVAIQPTRNKYSANSRY